MKGLAQGRHDHGHTLLWECDPEGHPKERGGEGRRTKQDHLFSTSILNSPQNRALVPQYSPWAPPSLSKLRPHDLSPPTELQGCPSVCPLAPVKLFLSLGCHSHTSRPSAARRNYQRRPLQGVTCLPAQPYPLTPSPRNPGRTLETVSPLPFPPPPILQMGKLRHRQGTKLSRDELEPRYLCCFQPCRQLVSWLRAAVQPWPVFSKPPSPELPEDGAPSSSLLPHPSA